MPKNQFLSKLNKPDYNNMLEEVLEKKPFTADTKSLLLSMLYKIEISYNDYSMVKKNVLPKNEFIEQIISTIKFCCDEIKLVEPNSEIAKQLDGKIAKTEKNTIIALPTEYALLTGIAQQIPLDFIVDNILEDETLKILSVGYKSDVTETISDFDGWTWNISKKTASSLIYQNIEILLGPEFVEQWQLGRKNIKNVKDRLFNLYNGEMQLLLFQEIAKVISKGLVIDFPEKTNEYLKKLEEDRIEFNQLDNTAEYVTKISEKKKKIIERIKEIDILLLDNDLLKQKYDEENASRPLEKKIFSMKHYGQLLKNEKEDLLKKKEEYNNAVKPATLVGKKEYLKKEIRTYENIENAKNELKSYEELVIEFQNIFLRAWQTKIERAKTKTELIDLIYVLRYYKNIRLNDYIKNITIIKHNIDAFERELLLKAVNSEVFVKLTENQLSNIDIISKVLDTNIIELEDISILSRIQDNIIVLDIYDGEVLDRTLELGEDIKVIQLKPNKKSKLFN